MPLYFITSGLSFGSFGKENHSEISGQHHPLPTFSLQTSTHFHEDLKELCPDLLVREGPIW